MRLPKPTRNSKSKSRAKAQSEDAMDCSRVSSSSVSSSSDSETGIITNDEDREGMRFYTFKVHILCGKKVNHNNYYVT